MVEQNKSGAYSEIVYTPSGSNLARMSGQSLTKVFVPLTGGSMAVYNSSGLAYYRHSDWIGTSRFASTPSRALYYDGAYAPFGEAYAQTGTADLSFTGMNQDTVANLYDFPAREYGTQGRWPSPDPVGLASVYRTDPQTWNRYAYVRNTPLQLFDPSGMVIPPPLMMGGGGGDGGFLSWLNNMLMMSEEGLMSEGAFGGGPGCTADGVDASCGMVMSMLGSGGAVQCPDNQCTRVGPNGVQYFWASTNGPGSYYYYSGPGALYYSLNAAVVAAFEYTFHNDPESASEPVAYEYGEAAYSDANGVFSFTGPIATQVGGCTIDTMCTFDPNQVTLPPNVTLAAILHSHPFGGGFTVPEDTGDADILNVPSYIGNPQGCIEFYVPGTSPNQGMLQGDSGICP